MARSCRLNWPLAAAAVLLVLSWLPGRAEHEVILLRHADKDTIRGDFNLSPAGFARAIGLARLIPACLGRPSSITTYFLNPESSKNARSYQTAVPLAVATGVPIRIELESPDHSLEVGQRLRQFQGAAGQRLVVFWEHRRMPELARGLGWDGLNAVADDDFDQILRFRYRTPGARPEVTLLRQSVLARQDCFRQARFPQSDLWATPFVHSSP